MEIGFISEIQKGSMHDGPGLRTVVFMKGCNMRCRWCHNPEAVYPETEVLHDPSKCIGCGQCEKGCYAGAQVVWGKTINTEEALAVIREDKAYYGGDGGVTFSGGEPLLQQRFLAEMLTYCRAEGIHTCVETNLLASWETVQSIATLCDAILCDLKLFDDEKHRAFTDAGNETILDNIVRLDRASIPLVVRTPVIASVNDDETEIQAIARFLSQLTHLRYYELLTYHPLGLSKPQSTHFKPVIFPQTEPGKVRQLGKSAASYGLPVKVDNMDLEGVR